MRFPGFENIFSLHEPFATRPFRGSLREAARGLDYHALASGRLVPSEPVRIVPYGGREVTDFIWTDAVVIRLVSRRVLDLLRASGIDGWSTFPVQVHGRDGQTIDGFKGLAVTGRCGKFDPAMSMPFLRRMPGGVFPHFRGRFFKPESWDGSNIFSPEATSHLFVTRAVHDLLRHGRARNVRYQPITEMEFGTVEKSQMEERLAED
jgi:hypothetical protein